ncbi:hypothetical protein QQ045_011461 [Rhodiola kirilowii]
MMISDASDGVKPSGKSDWTSDQRDFERWCFRIETTEETMGDDDDDESECAVEKCFEINGVGEKILWNIRFAIAASAWWFALLLLQCNTLLEWYPTIPAGSDPKRAG